MIPPGTPQSSTRVRLDVFFDGTSRCQTSERQRINSKRGSTSGSTSSGISWISRKSHAFFGGEDIFTQAFVKAELANLNREEQASYQTSLKVYRDWKSVIDTARDEGREEGREEGRRAAMAEALAGLQASGMPEAEARRLLGITG